MWFVSAEVYPRWFTLTITRSLAQGSACKDLGRNDQSPGHHVQGRLHSVFSRAGSRSHHNALPGAEVGSRSLEV